VSAVGLTVVYCDYVSWEEAKCYSFTAEPPEFYE